MPAFPGVLGLLVIEPLLTPEAVARRCGLSRRAVYDAIRRGELPAMRLCNRLRVRGEDLDAWFAGSVVQPAPTNSVKGQRKLSHAPTVAGSFRALMREGDGTEAA